MPLLETSERQTKHQVDIRERKERDKRGGAMTGSQDNALQF